MAEKTAEKFVEALKKLESEKDLDTITQLFSDSCEIGNVVIASDKAESPGEFWKMYRESFDQVSSSFKNKIIKDNIAALEWTTKGSTSDGSNFEYEGVSILEIEDDKITRFFAYFDPAKLGKQMKG